MKISVEVLYLVGLVCCMFYIQMMSILTVVIKRHLYSPTKTLVWLLLYVSSLISAVILITRSRVWWLINPARRHQQPRIASVFLSADKNRQQYQMQVLKLKITSEW